MKMSDKLQQTEVCRTSPVESPSIPVLDSGYEQLEGDRPR